MPFTDSLRFVEIIRAEKYQLTAKPEDVANGKTYVGTTRQLEVGTLPVHEEHGDITLVAGETYKVAYGKVPKDYNVVVKPLADQTPGTATADKILYPYTAVVNGETVTGTMPDNPPENVELASGESYNIPIGYHDGTEMITATALGNQTPGTATADDIAMDKTAWVNGVQITGNLPKIAAQTITLPFNGEYIIPAGIHSGLGKITQEVEVIEDQIVVAPSFHDQTISTAGKYLAQDIYVPGIDALNYEFITSGEFLINDPDTGNSLNNDITKVYKLSVDNWHDNATLNVYQYELNSTFGTLSGILYCNFLNGQTEFTINGGMFDLKIGLESGTNAHQITLNLHSGHDVGGLFTLKELYHARRYGDDHDVD